MKTAIKILSVLIVLAILAIAGLFGYSKVKEIDDLKKQLNQKQTENTHKDTTSNQQINQSNGNTIETSTDENNNDVASNEAHKNTSNTKVNRNNVFDYVIKGINDSGGDASLIRFQEPTYDASSDTWSIVANNKSGAGATYKINVTSTGHVTMYEGIDDDVVIDEDVSLN